MSDMNMFFVSFLEVIHPRTMQSNYRDDLPKTNNSPDHFHPVDSNVILSSTSKTNTNEKVEEREHHQQKQVQITNDNSNSKDDHSMSNRANDKSS
jgi:hypothetical protein